RALEGLDCLNIHKFYRFRAIKLQDWVKEKCSNPEKHSWDIQTLRDGLLVSLEKWKVKLTNKGDNCLFEQNNEDEPPWLPSFYSYYSAFRNGKRHIEWRPDIFMVDDAGKEIKAVEEYFPDSSLMKTEGWNDIEAQEQLIKMICVRGIARDMINTNNLIKAFHHKLKYTYMRRRPGCQLDGEVYILVEIPDVWIIHFITNDDVEYTVQKKDSNKNELDTKLIYIHDDNIQKQPFSVLGSPISSDDIGSVQKFNDNKNNEMLKLQEDFAMITAEWQNKKIQDICSLRTTLMNAAQIERTRIAKVDIVPQVNNDDKPRIFSN
ncbi:9036_t:CDS:2, partial [Funneliformis geosporum]